MKNRLFSRALLTAGLAGVLTSGCVTSKYNQRDIYSIPKSAHKQLTAIASQEPIAINRENIDSVSQSTNTISYEDAVSLNERGYGSLPQVNVEVYLPSSESENALLKSELSTSRPGYLNSYGFEIRSLEENIPSNSAKRVRFEMGSPSRDFVSSKYAAENQLSSRDGLLGLDLYAETAEGANFVVAAYQTSGFKKMKDSRRNAITIFYGDDLKESFGFVKRRDMKTDLIHAGEEVVAGGLISLPSGSFVPGALAMALLNGTEITWGYFEGKNRVPEGTSLITDSKVVSSLEGRVANVHSTLRQASKLGADEIVCDGNLIVYSSGADSVSRDGKSVTLTFDESRANEFKELLYHLMRAASVVGPTRYIDLPKDKVRKGGVPGEDDSGPGIGVFDGGDQGAGAGIR